jgi:hypothetical protein
MELIPFVIKYLKQSDMNKFIFLFYFYSPNSHLSDDDSHLSDDDSHLSDDDSLVFCWFVGGTNTLEKNN